MIEISLDMFQSAAAAAVVLVVGIYLVKRVPMLKRFCIPAAVIGGLLFSLVMLIFYSCDFMEITFDDTIKEIAMRMFFCSIGFMASISMIKSGGRMLLILIALLIALVTLQNFVGIFSVGLFDLDPKYGLALGSISLCGGHGTAAAYGGILVNDYGLVGADVVCIASATFGLAIAGLIGGPLARNLVRRYDLKPTSNDMELQSEIDVSLDDRRVLNAVVILAACIGLGTLLNMAFDAVDIAVPSYLGGMLVALFCRTVTDKIGYELPLKELETIGWVSLCIFLSMALMAIKLWQLADLAFAMVFTLLIQTVILIVFVYYIVFRATGKNYESAAFVAGVSGFGMGATPNAVANLEALTNEHGPAPVAYFLIPIMGGVFLDFINMGILTAFLNLL